MGYDIQEDLTFDEFENTHPKVVRKGPYVYSHIFIVIFLVICAVVIYFSCFLNREGPFKSHTPDYPFSNDVNPFFYVHISDIHVSHYQLESAERERQILHNISSYYNSPVVLVSGDLVDSTTPNVYSTYYQQFESDWELYMNITHEIRYSRKDRVLVEVCGNHDVMNVKDDGHHFYYRKYILGNREFAVESFVYQEPTQQKPLNFIRFNPNPPPMGQGLGGLAPHVSQTASDLLESSLGEESINIITSHFPINELWGSRSSKGTHIQTLLQKSPQMSVGHTHPSAMELYRYGDTLNCICPAMVEEDRFVIGTVDNGQFIYHEMDPRRRNDLIFTFPIPKSQLTSRSYFDYTDVPIRVLQFSEKCLPVKVFLDGKEMIQLDFQRELQTGVFFHSAKVTIEKGDHKILIKDNYSERSMDIFVGSEVGSVIRKGATFSVIPGAYFIYLVLGLVSFIVLVRLVPWWLLWGDIFDEFFRYLTLSQYESMKWYKVLWVAPLYAASRTRLLPLWLHIVMVFLGIFPLFIPIYLTDCQGTMGNAFVWSYVTHKGSTIEPTVAIITAAVLCVISLPPILITQLWYEFQKFATMQKIEFVLLWIFHLAWIAVWICAAPILGRSLALFGSPSFWIFITDVILLIALFVLSKRKYPKKEGLSV